MKLLGSVLPEPAQDVMLLLGRIALGVVLIAHGWQKFDEQGFSATANGFDAMNIPFPEAAAGFAIGVELIGGALLIAGLFTVPVGLLVVANMVGAWWFAHRENGIFVADGGAELVVVIGALGLVLAAVGAGRLSLDHALGSR